MPGDRWAVLGLGGRYIRQLIPTSWLPDGSYMLQRPFIDVSSPVAFHVGPRIQASTETPLPFTPALLAP